MAVILCPDGRFSPLSTRSPIFREPPPPPSLARGVGHNEQPLPCVWGTQGARRYNRPFRIVPELGKLPENDCHPPSKERCDVLNEDVPGTKLANEAGELSPSKAASLSVKPGSRASIADVSTHKSAGDEVNWGEVVCAGISNVSKPGNIGPLVGKNLGGIVVNFHLPRARHARPFQSEIDTAYACVD